MKPIDESTMRTELAKLQQQMNALKVQQLTAETLRRNIEIQAQQPTEVAGDKND